MKSLVGALTLTALSATSAQAACWSDRAVDAARVRDLDTMLMVSALRCRQSGNDLLRDYNDFVRDSRPALTQANDMLHTQFAAVGGANAYDRYVTSMANRYGAGAGGLSCREIGSILRAADAKGGSIAGLVRVADQAGVEPKLPGGLCPRAVASAR
jgi:hypothetical protein